MTLRTITALGIGIVLAACGGGGGGGGDLGPLPSMGGAPSGTTGATSATPASAMASVDAFIAYVRGLTADATSEPLVLPDFPAPKSDTTEPAA